MAIEQLWLIKYENGRIQGPLSVESIYNLIDEKKIVGTESIAVYPMKKWKPISSNSEFYDYLLQYLQLESSKKGVTINDPQPYEDKNISAATVVADPLKVKIVELKRKKKTVIKKPAVKKVIQPKTVIYNFDIDKTDNNKSDDSDIYVKPSDKRKLKFINKRRILVSLFGIVVIYLLVFFKDSSKLPSQDQHVELNSPKLNQPTLPKEQVEVLIKKGVHYFSQSSVSSYLKSQDLFIQAIEGDIKQLLAISFLCLTYMELWPFSKQDFRSINVISNLVHRSSVLNKGGVYSGLCYSVDLLLKKKYEEARVMIESSLNGLSNIGERDDSQQLIPFFYYLRASSMNNLNDNASVIPYLRITQKRFPKWVKPYLLIGKELLKESKISEAFSETKKALEINPNNKATQINYGIMEFKYFNQLEKAEQMLLQAINNLDLVSYQLMSEAYFTLAQIKIKKTETEDALLYAKKAYSYDPSNKASRNLIVQIGGQGVLQKTQIKSSQLIHKGDELVLANKFQDAIGYYETAFKIDKNAMVAIKVAKNLWKLSFFREAIKWLKKAIESDPKMVEAYVLMSNYYAHNYDFYNASKVLQIASQKFMRSYEVYRGMAYLSVKKEEYENAIRYAKVALKIYEADMQSYILLSESYAKIGSMNEAFVSASKALEVAPNSIKAQVAFAKAIGRMHGEESGSDYFRKLVINYSLNMEYRMEWAKYLFEDEEYDKAFMILKEIIDINPKYNEAYFYMGRVLMFNENYSGAYEAFLKSAIINPSNPMPSFYIGLLRMKEKKYDLAEEQFKKVLALNKLYPEAHYYLGKIAFLRGEKDNYYKAIEEARLETKSNPNLIAPFILAGESYEKLEEFLKCAGEYQRAIQLAPETMNYYVKTARCYRKSGYLDLAVNILKKILGTKDQKTGEPQLYRELGMILEMRANHTYAAGAYCNYLNLMPSAPDRSDIQKRIKKLSEHTGQEIKNCKYLKMNEKLLSLF